MVINHVKTKHAPKHVEQSRKRIIPHTFSGERKTYKHRKKTPNNMRRNKKAMEDENSVGKQNLPCITTWTRIIRADDGTS